MLGKKFYYKGGRGQYIRLAPSWIMNNKKKNLTDKDLLRDGAP
jgi:hypothetical protein